MSESEIKLQQHIQERVGIKFLPALYKKEIKILIRILYLTTIKRSNAKPISHIFLLTD